MQACPRASIWQHGITILDSRLRGNDDQLRSNSNTALVPPKANELLIAALS